MTLSGRFTLALCLLAISLLAAPPATARLYITEFLAENSDGLRDSDGDSSDWIEIFNSGPVTVNLGGYFLTDDESALTKWPIPSLQLDAGQFLLVFASEKDRRVAGQELHTNFKLDQQGEYLGLIAPDGSYCRGRFWIDRQPSSPPAGRCLLRTHADRKP